MATRKKAATVRKKPTPEERIAEYVDSPDMTQRVRHGKLVTARVRGNYGVYRVEAGVGKEVTGQCSCPSEWWPCKHVHALRQTWEINPKSFLDMKEFLKGLSEQSETELIDAIGQMVLKWPENLSVFGVPGFEPEEDEFEDEDRDEW